MNKDEARERVRTRYNEGNVKRPLHDHPDDRSEYQQIMSLESERFEDRLAEAAMNREKAAGDWPNQKWFNKHRSQFLEGLRERYRDPMRPKPIDPPCKSWREKLGECDADILSTLNVIWERNLSKWALDYHYLSSPSDYCECHEHSTGPKKTYRDAQAWDMPEWMGEES